VEDEEYWTRIEGTCVDEFVYENNFLHLEIINASQVASVTLRTDASLDATTATNGNFVIFDFG
jgi:hypothetical protein